MKNIENNIIDKDNTTKKEIKKFLDDGYKIIWPNNNNIKVNIFYYDSDVDRDLKVVKPLNLFKAKRFFKENNYRKNYKDRLLFIPCISNSEEFKKSRFSLYLTYKKYTKAYGTDIKFQNAKFLESIGYYHAIKYILFKDSKDSKSNIIIYLDENIKNKKYEKNKRKRKLKRDKKEQAEAVISDFLT